MKVDGDEVQAERVSLEVEEKEEGLVASASEFVKEVIEEATKGATWEQLMELHSALLSIASLNRFVQDRRAVLDALQASTQAWARSLP